MTFDIKWDKIFQWEYIDGQCCIAAFASDYGGKTNIIIIIDNISMVFQRNALPYVFDIQFSENSMRFPI